MGVFSAHTHGLKLTATSSIASSEVSCQIHMPKVIDERFCLFVSCFDHVIFLQVALLGQLFQRLSLVPWKSDSWAMLILSHIS